jgi:cell wall-associated NlpC family hydrolase
MVFIIPLSDPKISIPLFLFRFCKSGIKTRENASKRHCKNSLAVLLLILLFLGLTSCGSFKPSVVTTKMEAAETKETRTVSRPRLNRTVKVALEKEEEQIEETTNEKSYAETNDFIDEVVENAMSYQGVKYRYGGTTSKGMDCSGLIGAAFMEAGKTMPRTSRSLSSEAEELNLDQVRKGDFLFFATGKNKRQVNHVALITRVTPGEIEFIHSTTSRGVITSTLNEAYWINAFLRAGRID